MPDQQKPLKDIRILVTRPQHQNQHLSQLIHQAGGHAIMFPVLEIVAPDNVRLVQHQLSNTMVWDWIIFTSANAVNYAIDIASNQLPISPTTRIAAIGANTVNTLHQHGITVDLIPTISSSEGLLASLQLQQINNQQCLIIKGEAGRTVLATLLDEKGAVVTTVEVYRRICPNSNAAALITQWTQQTIDYVTITSVEALNNLIQLIGENGFKLLQNSIIVALSQRIHDAANNKGLANAVIAASASDSGLLESMVQTQKIGLKSAPRVQSE